MDNFIKNVDNLPIFWSIVILVILYIEQFDCYPGTAGSYTNICSILRFWWKCKSQLVMTNQRGS